MLGRFEKIELFVANVIAIGLNIVVGAEGDPKNQMICSFGNADHDDCINEAGIL